MDWKERYRGKLISAEEAANMVKTGDVVSFTSGREARTVGLALAARKEEVQGLKVMVPTPGVDFGWYDQGWEDSFGVVVGYPLPVVQEMVDEKRCDLALTTVRSIFGEERFDDVRCRADVLLVEVSPPDGHGYCSFGASVWDKKRQVEAARTVIGEVNDHLIRTYGDNFVHESEIDYFVEHEFSGEAPAQRNLRYKDIRGTSAEAPEERFRAIAGYIAEFIHDGDTLQIGVGSVIEHLVRLGLLNNKHDLGWHSEHTPGGIIRLVMEGVFTGNRKTLDKGKMVSTAIAGSRQELEFASMNPMFELREVYYTNDIRAIAAQDNMVSINQCMAVDLTGQIASESIAGRLIGAAGGQPAFVIGTRLAKGGRAITAVPSTAKNGTVSCITPVFAPDTVVTVPRSMTDIVVTEYGVARLPGKTLRERAEELIAIAHPDFRAELRRQAQKSLWP